MMPALRSLAARRPGRQISMVQVAGLDQLSALRRGEVDVVLHRETHIEDFGDFGGLERRVLFDDPLLAMLPPGHPAGRTGRVRLADLAGERLVMISRAGKPLVFDRTLQLCREAGFEPTPIAEVVEPMAMALAVAAQGMVGLTGAGMSNRYPGVDYLPVEPGVGIAQVSAVWAAAGANPLVAAFVDRLDPATVTGPVSMAAEPAP
jgi:DNA-binding transcriptional LysR family regulator